MDCRMGTVGLFFTMLSVTDGEARASDLNEITKDLSKRKHYFFCYCIL